MSGKREILKSMSSITATRRGADNPAQGDHVLLQIEAGRSIDAHPLIFKEKLCLEKAS